MKDDERSGRRRRLRAVVFGVAALTAAAVAAMVANGYGSRVAGSYGPLRPAVVTASSLERGEVIGPGTMQKALIVRQVPARFIPPGSLSAPEQALGLEPSTRIPAGGYVLASLLHPPGPSRRAPAGLGRGRRPVEIAVAGADALMAAGPLVAGAPVDVVVTAEPQTTGPGRTYIAARRVPLLGLKPGAGGGLASATLALTRPQALELISAESFARQVRLLPVPGA